MKPFISVIIKPTLDCNIACKHCYHTPSERTPERMDIFTLEKVFELISEEYESAWFIWHGGEPLLMPFKFYKDGIELQEKYFGKNSHRVGNTIQTNGILLDRKFINFCKEKMINIGVSFEGPFNDVLRQRTNDVSKNLDYLEDKERVFSVSSTISSETADKQNELYEHFRAKNMAVSFSPVILAGCGSCGDLVPDPDVYIRSSIECFDRWLTDKDTEIPLIPHYLYILNALGEPTESDCAHTSCLTKWLCVYPNGDLYPCGKGCPTDFRLDNVDNMERISDAFNTDGFRNILMGTIKRREKCMSECDLYRYCNGGCSIDAHYETGIENTGGDSCRIFREVFGHVLESVEGIIQDQKDLSNYNKFVRDAVLGKLINPKIVEQ